jgi:hypothetical protein
MVSIQSYDWSFSNIRQIWIVPGSNVHSRCKRESDSRRSLRLRFPVSTPNVDSSPNVLTSSEDVEDATHAAGMNVICTSLRVVTPTPITLPERAGILLGLDRPAVSCLSLLSYTDGLGCTKKKQRQPHIKSEREEETRKEKTQPTASLSSMRVANHSFRSLVEEWPVPLERWPTSTLPMAFHETRQELTSLNHHY